MEKHRPALPSAMHFSFKTFKSLAVLATILFLVTVSSLQSGPVKGEQPASNQWITKFGQYSGIKKVWSIKVSEGTNGLEISWSSNFNNVAVKAPVGSAAFTGALKGSFKITHSVEGWQANPGWFVYVENETYVWYCDGKERLQLLKQDGMGSATYCSSFPRPIPANVIERLPESLKKELAGQQSK